MSLTSVSAGGWIASAESFLVIGLLLPEECLSMRGELFEDDFSLLLPFFLVSRFTIDLMLYKTRKVEEALSWFNLLKFGFKFLIPSWKGQLQWRSRSNLSIDMCLILISKSGLEI